MALKLRVVLILKRDNSYLVTILYEIGEKVFSLCKLLWVTNTDKIYLSYLNYFETETHINPSWSYAQCNENVNWHVCGLQILLQFVSQWKCGLLFWWILWSDLLNNWWSKVKILFFKTNAKQHNRLRLVLGPGKVNIWHILFKYPIPCKKVLNSSSWSWTTVKCPWICALLQKLENNLLSL